MPKIISAFNGENELGSTIAKLGASMFGGPTTENAINNEKLYALQRENTERDNYAKMIADGGVMPTANNPIAQAMIIAAGLDPRNSAYLGRMDAATRYGADDPRTANWQVAGGDPYSATAPAFNANLAEDKRAHDLTSSNQRYNVDQDVALKKFLNENASAADKLASGDRRYGVDQSQITERTKPFAAYDPVTKSPLFLPTDKVTATPGIQPILSNADRQGTLLGENWNNLAGLDPMQRQVLGANPTDTGGSVWNYITPQGTFLTTNGVTDVDGVKLPPNGYRGTVEGSATEAGVTKAVQTDLQTDLVAADKFTMLGNGMLQLTKEHPEAFGLVGKVTGMAQEANQALSAVSTLFGGEQGVDTAINSARSELMRLGKQNLVPSLYNPNIPKVQMLGGLMLYSAASALGGQENRSVSDTDIKKMEQIIGDPQSMFESAQSIQTKVSLAMKIVAAHKQLAQQYLGQHPGTTTIPPEAGLVDMAIATALSDQNDTMLPAQTTNQPVTEGVTKSGNRFRVIGQ